MNVFIEVGPSNFRYAKLTVWWEATLLTLRAVSFVCNPDLGLGIILPEIVHAAVWATHNTIRFLQMRGPNFWIN